MDCLGPALFGFILVAFTVSKPIGLSSSSESSESSESSSSEETVLRSTAQPKAVSSIKMNLRQVNIPTSSPSVLLKTIHNTITGQTVDMKKNLIPLPPAVSAKPETVIETDLNVTTVSARGDSVIVWAGLKRWLDDALEPQSIAPPLKQTREKLLHEWAWFQRRQRTHPQRLRAENTARFYL